ncbi:MAG: hypothetical protein BM485_12030 [Desulfobulbaceae bacterium DB1]|nr:MAG: hypothetical protein BM485_12030 [Desulfobulbaceae bacterium DB1]
MAAIWYDVNRLLPAFPKAARCRSIPDTFMILFEKSAAHQPDFKLVTKKARPMADKKTTQTAI